MLHRQNFWKLSNIMVMEQSSSADPLEIVFIPFLAPTHMLPLADAARMLAARGQHVTILTTPTNAATLLQKPVDADAAAGRPIRLSLIPFPSEAVDLPAGIESFSPASDDVATAGKLFRGINLLRSDMERRITELRPDCIVSDMFYPWTADLAARLRIPRLCFQVQSVFALALEDSIIRHSPHEAVGSESDPFEVPGVPGPTISMTRSQLPDYLRLEKPLGQVARQWREAALKSYGILVNSFYELEPSYTESYQEAMGHKVYHVGPTVLSIQRDSPGEHECLSWLDSKPANSVVYVSFGSGARFPDAQLLEIARALDASGHPFIWVVLGKDKCDDDDDDDDKLEPWLPLGFEQKLKEHRNGIIVRGWAPQVPILSHPGIGGFVTHCGWNSVVEAVTAGVPMVAWPLYSEQFYNEKLVTQVLGVGVGVGAEEWSLWTELGKKKVIGRERIEEAVRSIMGAGAEAAEMRKKAGKLAAAAKKAAAGGGSSDKYLTALVDDLKKEKSSQGTDGNAETSPPLVTD